MNISFFFYPFLLQFIFLSRVRGSLSNRYWQDSDPWDDRPWIAPDLPVDDRIR